MPREQLLAGFAKAGVWDASAPGPELAAAVAAAAGPEWRCRGASGEQQIGILGRLAALESWAAAGKLGVIRALIRDDDPAFLSGARHGDLPDAWDDALTHEVALALAASVPSAGKTMRAAWELGARLPEIGALLRSGIIDAGKARLIAEVFAGLSDEGAGRAEALIAAELTEPPAKTYAQVERIATLIALTVDPALGEGNRKAAQKHNARVQMFRERAGTAALSGRDLATDQALAAHASVCARAEQYKDSGAFPLAQMDQLRAAAYLDLLNSIPAHERIAHGLLTEQTPAGTDPSANHQTDADTGTGRAPESAGEPRPGGDDCPCRECDGTCTPDDDNPGDDDPGDSDPDDDAGPDGNPGDDAGPGDGRGDEGPDGDGPGGGGQPGKHGGEPAGEPGKGSALPPSPSRAPAGGPPPVLQDLVIPLATLLGLADRPGEGHGLGALDPDLCRTLAATAAASPRTTLCVTITDHDGIAIGHGCGKPTRPATQTPGGPAPPLIALPARINLTITADRLTELLSAAPEPLGEQAPPTARAPGGWALAPCGDPRTRAAPGPPGDPHWCGPWTLTLPGGRELTLRPEPVPTYECDHRNESHAYQPSDKLRHLVQVRDYTCTFPPCNRHARDSDFEHAVPYDQGGRTCACNAGARSRQCHRVKQSPGWKVTQPRPGWHQWETPRGRTYTQGPKQYPV